MLTLNKRRAVARLAQAVKMAQQKLMPEEYYALDCDDPNEATKQYLEALLRSRLHP